MRYLRLYAHTRRHPSAILLLVQLLGMVLYPFIENTDAGRIGLACSASWCWASPCAWCAAHRA